MARVIAVATSIPPVLVRQNDGRAAPDYQALCIQSWIGNGFRVLSVNFADEIPALAERYPGVTFIPTARDARQWTGRKNPYIADLLLALKDAEEPVLGLINSDLLFEPSTAWAEHLPSRVAETMVVAHRYNTHSLQHGALRRFQGLDCFFFDKSTALRALENAWPFAIGAPWWDYWLPCIALLNNRTITVVDRPAILHLFHKAAYSGNSQKEFGHHFANTLIQESEKATHGEPAAFAAVKPMLEGMVASSVDDVALKRQFVQICETLIFEIRKNVAWWDNASRHAPGDSLNDAFEHFDRRLLAGDALQNAKTLLMKNQSLGPDLIAKLSQVPTDPDIRLILGEISMRRGELETANGFFAGAAELLPDAPGPLHGQGMVLQAQGRHEAALSCFRRALEIEPDYQPSNIAAARALWDLNKKEEAIDFLDGVLARNPHLERVADLKDKYCRLTNR